MGKVVAGVSAAAAVAATAWAAVMVRRCATRRRKWEVVMERVKELEEECETNVARLRQVVDAMAVEMHAGLASDGGSKLQMLLSFVDNLPNGSEEGVYYALDVGGTNFRILRVLLGGEKSSPKVLDVERQPIPKTLMEGTSEAFFDFLASAIQTFVEKEEKSSESSQCSKRQLGFTFSFPVNQKSISSGDLIKWTKGFAIKDMVGKEVTGCLRQALNKRDVDMQVAALVNDTVGALALGHHQDQDTVAAIIIGTGTNACYVERTDAIIKSQGLVTKSGGMVINTEWGNFWSSHLPRTSYDTELDANTPNPNDMAFEKMISGMYLGEIVRRVILRMAQESDIFGIVSPKLSKAFALGTPLVTTMHEDTSPELEEVARIMTDFLEVPDISLKARKLVVKVCDIITRRAARLAAAGITGILKKVGRDGSDGKMRRTVVAVEGGLYANYRAFREYLHEALVEILGADVAQNVVLMITEDGSGVGAALLAASHPPGHVNTV